jgi:tetratricopeptide (TPR) repeat protein
VTLLGTYLAEVCGGNIRHRERFKFGDVILTPKEEDSADKTIRYAKRAEKVIAGYLEQFNELAKGSADLGGPEQALLHLLGLFDRPAEGAAVDMLLSERIPGLTDDLFVERVKTGGFQDVTPRERIARLRDHPMVRAYFAARLEETAPEAAKAAHMKLYVHYFAAKPDLPETLEAMQPLFHAVQHGVKAGRVQEACEEVFFRRIRRGNAQYTSRVLCAFGADLAALANFFEVFWTTPRRELRADNQAWVRSEAAFDLRALGRLGDSVEPRQAGLAANVAREDWRNAAIAGSQLCTTRLALGAVKDAIAAAEQAVEHADRSAAGALQADDTYRAVVLSALANAHFQAGDTDRAVVLFADAEAIMRKHRRDFKALMSLSGYWYADLLLSQGKSEDALERGRDQLRISEEYPPGRGMGLLEKGLAWLLIGQAQDTMSDDKAAASFDAAVETLRKAGQEQLVPQALLARAAHRRRRVAAGESGLLELLRADLDEVADIAEPEMRLYLTDLALERARLALDVPAAFTTPKAARAEAQAQIAKAADLIAATGYHRRDQELAELQAHLATV